MYAIWMWQGSVIHWKHRHKPKLSRWEILSLLAKNLWLCRMPGAFSLNCSLINWLLLSCAICYCYTSTQNTCVWLVQITSRDAHKYAIVTFSATTQWHSALHGGTIDNSALAEGTIWLADASHASLTFETSVTISTPNLCIVAKQYVIRYQQTTMFTSFEESAKYYKFCV